MDYNIKNTKYDDNAKTCFKRDILVETHVFVQI